MIVRVYIIIAVFICCFAGVAYVNNNIFALWSSNVVRVKVEGNLHADLIRIYYGNHIVNINDGSDADLLAHRYKYQLVYGGDGTSSPRTDYGENDFLVVYGDSAYYSFRHFVFNCNHQHAYNFTFSPAKNGILMAVDVDGHDKIKFDAPMALINKASKNRCNELIDTSKVIYNMKTMQQKCEGGNLPMLTPGHIVAGAIPLR